jgi:hypothetical protein
MTQRTESFTKWLALGLAGALLAVGGCSDDSTKPDEADPPGIPPVSTFVLDTAAFPDTSSSGLHNPATPIEAAVAREARALAYQNWGWAALNVAVWNTIITVTLAVPVAAFVESFNHEPEQRPDGSWVWSYDFSIVQVQYSAELHGALDATGVKWDMYISKAGGYSDFHWYSGHSDYLVTEGWWTLNKNPDAPEPFIGIEWHRAQDGSTGDIKYTVIEPDSPGNGGYIHHGIVGGQPALLYDAFYDIYHVEDDNHIDIEWSRASWEGRVKDPAHFGDEDWHYWDGNLEDTE